MSVIRDWFDAVGAAFTLKATEIRTGTSLIEAVAADEFQVQLRYVTTSEAERADLRECAILCGKLGLTAEELPDLIRDGMRSRWPAEGSAS